MLVVTFTVFLVKLASLNLIGEHSVVQFSFGLSDSTKITSMKQNDIIKKSKYDFKKSKGRRTLKDNAAGFG